MIRLVCLGVALLCLSACDNTPSARQVLAKCLAQPNAKLPSGSPDIGLLQTCMQAQGYFFDADLADKCRTDETPQSDPVCYQNQPWMTDKIKQMGGEKPEN
jgi:hypothetical protein